jgi:hypothetical protein
MHKAPAQIARSLRAFRNAYRLGLLRSVVICPGPDACEEAKSQRDVEYLGNVVPRLPLARCTCDYCECDYSPIGSDRLQRLNANRKLPSKPGR